ncbi:hypothetical protein [Flaviaesturariibacter amylovorans]|uniref:DUF4142 domain-containing protein n=1 Tax=Flaviaesturariibacter amylovorans TaxID=1084520 RepID=A0ABP8HLT8_9BACT
MTKFVVACISLTIISCTNGSNPSEAETSAPDVARSTTESSTAPAVSKPAINQRDLEEYKADLHRIVERLSRQLSEVPLTGVAESDLSKLLIIDFFSALELCRLQQKRGIHEEFRKLAQNEAHFFEGAEDYFHEYQLSHVGAYRPPQKGKRYPVKHIVIPEQTDMDGAFIAVLAEYNDQTARLLRDFLPKLKDTAMKRKVNEILQHLLQTNRDLKSVKEA